MAKIVDRYSLDVQVQLTINLEEARALDALSGYGVETFIKVFYEKLGEAYMKTHERGLRSFLTSIKSDIPPILGKVDKVAKVFLE